MHHRQRMCGKLEFAGSLRDFMRQLHYTNGRIFFVSLLVSGICCGLWGCGYQRSVNGEPASTTGYKWKSLYREDVQTVAVPIFTSKDFRRGSEIKLSKAVINQLEAHTPYKVVSRDHADTILEGEISRIEVSNLSRNFVEGVPQEQLMSVTVNFTWKDLRTGKILAEEKNFQQAAAFYPVLGEGEFAGNQQAIEKLALAIVQRLQADW